MDRLAQKLSIGLSEFMCPKPPSHDHMIKFEKKGRGEKLVSGQIKCNREEAQPDKFGDHQQHHAGEDVMFGDQPEAENLKGFNQQNRNEENAKRDPDGFF